MQKSIYNTKRKCVCYKKKSKEKKRKLLVVFIASGFQTDDIDKHTSGKRTIYYMYVNEATMMARKKLCFLYPRNQTN